MRRPARASRACRRSGVNSAAVWVWLAAAVKGVAGRVSMAISSASRRGERPPPPPSVLGMLSRSLTSRLRAIRSPQRTIQPELRPPAPSRRRATLEEAAGLADRIDDVGHLQRLREEVLVDEQVVAREEDPEVGVRVVPAHDVEVGMETVALAADLLPGVVGVREARLRVFIMFRLERARDHHHERPARHVVDALLAQAGSPPSLDRRRSLSARCRSIASAVIRSRKMGRSAGPGNSYARHAQRRSRSGRQRRSGSRYFTSSKTISSLKPLTPHDDPPPREHSQAIPSRLAGRCRNPNRFLRAAASGLQVILLR